MKHTKVIRRKKTFINQSLEIIAYGDEQFS